jgi:hypothetical protein
MWKPRRLTTLWASTAWYRHGFTFYLSKHRTKFPLHGNRRPRVVKPQHAFSFYSRDSIFTTMIIALQVEIFGNSNGANYKLDHIIYSYAFSLHSFSFQWMNNDTVKLYTCHVHSLYLGQCFICCMWRRAGWYGATTAAWVDAVSLVEEHLRSRIFVSLVSRGTI